MKKTGKVLAVLLMFSIVISIFSVTAFAQVASGTCGTNVRWSLDANGVVTVSGSGSMENYNYYDNPWDAYKNTIKSVVIGNGITSIGDYAFYDCALIESISISNTVKRIGLSAFNGCSPLKNISIPSSVESMGTAAFYRSQASLESISVDSKNKCFRSINNCLVEISTKKLVLGCKNSIIPADATVTSIADFAFASCKDLVSVELPSCLNSLGYNSFAGCASLESINIPEAITEIPRHAFDGCSSLKKVNIHNSVSSLGECAFGFCSSLESIFIGSSVSYIDPTAFFGCGGIEEITVNSNNAVYHSSGNCLIETESKTLIQGSKNSIIPSDKSVLYIGESAFGGNEKLTEIVIPSSVISIGNFAFSDCKALERVVISDSVTSIGQSAFIRCPALVGVILPDSLISVGGYAFYDCPSLKSIVIPASVTTIGSYAFGYRQGSAVWDDAKVSGFEVWGAYGSEAEIYAINKRLSFVEASFVTILPDSESEFFVGDGLMPNIRENTAAFDVVYALAECGMSVCIFDKTGNVMSSSSFIGTGCKVETSDGDTYTVIVSGDVDGSGLVDSTDYLKIKGYFCGLYELDDISGKSADVDSDGLINTTDYLRVKCYFLGMYDLYN